MDEELSGPPGDRMGRFEADLARLQGQLRRANREVAQMKWALFAVILLAISGVGGIWAMRSGRLGPRDLFGAGLPGTVESKEFGLYNRDGQRVLIADIDKWGLPNLVFLDRDLNYKMGLKVYKEGGESPGVVFYDRTGTRALFRMGGEGEARIDLLGANGKGGIAMSTSVDGKPSLKMTDQQGRVVFEAPTPAPGDPAADAPKPNDSATSTGRPTTPR